MQNRIKGMRHDSRLAREVRWRVQSSEHVGINIGRSRKRVKLHISRKMVNLIYNLLHGTFSFGRLRVSVMIGYEYIQYLGIIGILRPLTVRFSSVQLDGFIHGRLKNARMECACRDMPRRFHDHGYVLLCWWSRSTLNRSHSWQIRQCDVCGGTQKMIVSRSRCVAVEGQTLMSPAGKVRQSTNGT